MTRRPNDPFKHKSEMTALAVMIRSRAERAEHLVDEVLESQSDRLPSSDEASLLQAKAKMLEIIDLVEGP